MVTATTTTIVSSTKKEKKNICTTRHFFQIYLQNQIIFDINLSYIVQAHSKNKVNHYFALRSSIEKP